MPLESGSGRSATTPARQIFACLLLAAVIFAAGAASLQLLASRADPHVSTLWLPSGIALAAVLLHGYRLLPGVWLGVFAVFWSSVGFTGALLPATAATAATWLAALILRRLAGFNLQLDRLRDVTSLLVYGVLAAPLLSALGAIAGLIAAGVLPAERFTQMLTAWWLGDAIGVLLVTPLLLAIATHVAYRLPAPRVVEAIALIVLQAMLALALVTGVAQAFFGSERLNFLLLPLAMALALRHRLVFTAAANLALFAIAEWAITHGYGPVVTSNATNVLLATQVAVAAFAAITLIVNAISEERAGARAIAEENQDRFRELNELSSDWYWEQDAELRFTFLSAAVTEKTGVPPDARLGRRRWEVAGVRFDDDALAAHKALLAAHKPFRDFVYRRIAPDGREIWISTSGKPIYDRDGRFAGYRGIGRDITFQHVAERALHDERRFFEGILNAIASPIVVKDADHRFIAFNATAELFLNRPSAEMIGKTDYDLFPSERARYLQQTDDLALASNEPIEYESQYNVNGKQYTMLVRKSALMHPDGRRVLVLVMTDITARKAAEDALRASERRFRDIAEVAGEYVWENDCDGRFSYISPRVSEVLGYRAEELIGHTAAEFMPPGEAERVRAWFGENMNPDGTFKGLEHQLIAKSGQVLWLQINGTATWDADGRRTGHRGTTRDITELKVSEARISYLATRDPLTELPNRLLFNDRLEQGTINARRSGEAVGVLFIDLDRFKNINDSLGHHVGDLLLKEVAQRMSACLRGGDTIARLGGDEFVIALEHLRKAEDAANVAEKIIRSLARPVEVAGNTLNTSCSIGISIFPEDGDDASTLMKNADTAMYHAKEQGRNNFQFFSVDMNVRAVERHKLEIALRRGLHNGEFVLLYQPQVAFGTGAVVGAEALIRWQDPERGLIPPSGFISVAEESGLIEPIGRWVLMEACAQARRWQEQGLLPARVAVNISARQLLNPREFLDYVNYVLDQTGLDPRFLELEMTESLLLNNVEENAAALRRLGKLGVHIAVDDFGTGYSSLAYLKQLPIDSLKVDRTFVRDIESDPDDAAIIGAVIAMAHGLKLRVTAEGVETHGQLEALRALNCDEYQGYLLSKPIPADEFARRFLTGSALKLVR